MTHIDYRSIAIAHVKQSTGIVDDRLIVFAYQSSRETYVRVVFSIESEQRGKNQVSVNIDYNGNVLRMDGSK